MNNSKLYILFFLLNKKTNAREEAPILCRITFNKQRNQFYTGAYINPKNWNSKKQSPVPIALKDNLVISNQLNIIKSNLQNVYLKLQVNEDNLTVDDIYNSYIGKTLKKDYGVLEAYSEHNVKQKQLVGIDLKHASYMKFEETERLVKKFITKKYNTNNLLLKDLKYSFITDFEFFLKTESKFVQSTINKTIQRFRKIIRFAVAEDWIDKDPFLLYKAKRVKKEVVYLSQEELKALEEHKFEIKRVEYIRDLFVFCCYTGLAFNEMSNLRKHHVIKGFDGNLWIEMTRLKTSKKLQIPILPKALELIQKYEDAESDRVFPSISNSKFNAYLKEIADVVGIKKWLTHHIGRKTFATTVLLYNNVPMEIVSTLLGHSKISITQEHYGQIVQKRVGEEMKSLEEKLKK